MYCTFYFCFAAISALLSQEEYHLCNNQDGAVAPELLVSNFHALKKYSHILALLTGFGVDVCLSLVYEGFGDMKRDMQFVGKI